MQPELYKSGIFIHIPVHPTAASTENNGTREASEEVGGLVLVQRVVSYDASTRSTVRF